MPKSPNTSPKQERRTIPECGSQYILERTHQRIRLEFFKVHIFGFQYCPLYALGRNCGGNFRYTPSGIKDCSGCMIPHEKDNFGRITGRFQELCERLKELEKE